MKKVYQPNLLETIHPIVITGSAIRGGTIVTITGQVNDPLGKFVYIEDDKGNRMSVNKGSLRK